MASFTKLEGQYLAFIDAYTKVNARPPVEEGIATILRRNTARGSTDDS